MENENEMKPWRACKTSIGISKWELPSSHLWTGDLQAVSEPPSPLYKTLAPLAAQSSSRAEVTSWACQMKFKASSLCMGHKWS